MKSELSRTKPSRCDGCGHRTQNTYYLRRGRIELLLCEKCLRAIKSMTVVYINKNKHLTHTKPINDIGHE